MGTKPNEQAGLGSVQDVTGSLVHFQGFSAAAADKEQIRLGLGAVFVR